MSLKEVGGNASTAGRASLSGHVGQLSGSSTAMASSPPGCTVNATFARNMTKAEAMEMFKSIAPEILQRALFEMPREKLEWLLHRRREDEET